MTKNKLSFYFEPTLGKSVSVVDSRSLLSLTGRRSSTGCWGVVPRYFWIAALVCAVPAAAQLPRAITEDKNIRVTQATPEAALMQLEDQYADLVRNGKANSADAREVAAQISQIRAGLERLGRPVPSRGRAVPTTSSALDDRGPLPNEAMTNGNSLGGIPDGGGLQREITPRVLIPNSGETRNGVDDRGKLQSSTAALPFSGSQIQLLRDRRDQLLQEFGANHPSVRQMESLLQKIDAQVLQNSRPANDAVANPKSGSGMGLPGRNAGGFDAGDPLLSEQDPYRLVQLMAQRLVQLEQEVRILRAEIVSMRSGSRSGRETDRGR
ncbi:MAG: hypothetical protein AAF989_16385, partial [Planctomycetota bacterium]